MIAARLPAPGLAWPAKLPARGSRDGPVFPDQDAEDTLEGPGLDLLFRGLLHLTKDDHEVLALAEPILDALYAALQERASGRARW